MPTINQLVRKPRKVAVKKSKSPALGRVHNALKDFTERNKEDDKRTSKTWRLYQSYY